MTGEDSEEHKAYVWRMTFVGTLILLLFHLYGVLSLLLINDWSILQGVVVIDVALAVATALVLVARKIYGSSD